MADVFGRDGGDAPDMPPLPEVAPHHESDTDEVIPPTPEAELKRGRKRVRKMKDKTYVDEDGYICKYGSAFTKVFLADYVWLDCDTSLTYRLHGWVLIPGRDTGICIFPTMSVVHVVSCPLGAGVSSRPALSTSIINVEHVKFCPPVPLLCLHGHRTAFIFYD